MQKHIATIGILILGITACGKPPVSQAYAQCESDAYTQIGVQADSSASLQYLEQKYELIRVCLVRQGYKYANSNGQQTYALQIHEEVSKSYGTWNTPFALVDKGTRDEVQNVIDKKMVLFKLRSTNWEN